MRQEKTFEEIMAKNFPQITDLRSSKNTMKDKYQNQTQSLAYQICISLLGLPQQNSIDWEAKTTEMYISQF